MKHEIEKQKKMEKEDVEDYFKSKLIPQALKAAFDTLNGDDNNNRQKMVDSVLDRAGIARKQETTGQTQVTFNIPPEYLKDALTGVTNMLEANKNDITTVDRKGLGND